LSPDFAARVIGMFVFALLGSRLGLDWADPLGLPDFALSVLFGLVGALFGLVMTPIVTTRPIRQVRRIITELPIEVLFTSILGLLIGLLLGLLLAYPFSLLSGPLGDVIPATLSVVLAYLFGTIFNARSREVWSFLHEWLGLGSSRIDSASRGEIQYLLDTSVLIDGRIVDIAKTGFLIGTLVVPRFVIDELHRVADSSDTQRRNRGRRGLAKLTELQRDPTIAFRVIEDDVEEESEVDDKLVALALRTDSPILTIDFPMNQVARAQGVTVLNINMLANAVRSAYIPGETFALRILQEGKEVGQGVGYLDDGTMVIVENGKQYLDRTIFVEVTKLINKEAGRIIFARPVDKPSA
jgi:uncharacterized protein YacL